MKVTRKIIEINEDLCTGCGQCILDCAEGALKIENGKAKLVGEIYCDGLGACLSGCPTGALKVVEREAEDFDEQAVHELLKKNDPQKKDSAAPAKQGCGCPGSSLRSFEPHTPSCLPHGDTKTSGSRFSALTHWPIQIKLVPSTAPFLKGADLLIAADCTAFAYGNFHNDLLAGKVMMIGCPKLDHAEEYFSKFVDIFQHAGLKRITVVRMEVPCCSKLPMLIMKAREITGINTPVEEIVVGIEGDIQKRQLVAA
jgi:NAD-dependent dihydropyrimidine dehydrogenase PreA subunit